MSKKRKRKERREERNNDTKAGSWKESLNLHPDIKKNVWAVAFSGLTIILILAAASQAGPWGDVFYSAFHKLFGWGYFFLPVVSFLFALSFFTPDRERFFGVTAIAGGVFVFSGLGFVDLISPGSGGLVGSFIGAIKNAFNVPASLVITGTILVGSFIVVINKPILHLRLFQKKIMPDAGEEETESGETPEPKADEEKTAKEGILKGLLKPKGGKSDTLEIAEPDDAPLKSTEQKPIHNYVPPPLDLLVSSVEKPTVGDLRANANIIKRTLESFGIAVEMGEINVGPTVTRYTLKPAEGVKLSRITALNQDLSLALAAHPIRIEAPIPGKSFVGVEVPNKSAAIVRLGSLLLYPEFQKGGTLTFVIGRNLNGDPVFADIAKMPHMLIAGATGSGKSIAIHTLILALLYRNSPETLRMIMIDPKRVELSVYSGLPHLIAPVVTENKKAMGALRWLVQEMERRYQVLLEAGARDIKSYNKTYTKHPLPYIVAIFDELADLMTSHGREVESFIIRLAQMSRATGIHLVVSTQRPSVEVITGLIKANITTRIALQVASQIDSRTILDTAGAEKLLGSGDLLYVSSDMSKPARIQGGFVTEEEIKKVSSFIIKNNKSEGGEIALDSNERAAPDSPSFDDMGGAEGDDDELYDEALEVVRSAQKASASLLQRRLKVGYARAARLLDIMEERNVIGPGDGAKAREVYIVNEETEGV